MIDFFTINKKLTTINYIIIVLILCIISINGINLGVDFIGGVNIEISSDAQQINKSYIKKFLPTNSLINDVSGTNNILINFKIPTDTQHETYIKSIKETLLRHIPSMTIIKEDYVGPSVSKDIIYSGSIAIIFATLGIFLYMLIRFNIYFAISGIIALLNDIIITIGFFSITKIEFSIASIASILTIIGYSINDSVIIYDRIRENLKVYKNKNIPQIINTSINSTLKRTILTSSTTLLSVIILIAFTSSTIADFSWPIFFGIIAGTFSSIVIAPTILARFL